MKVDMCEHCDIPENPVYYDVESEWYFTCSDCACYDCPHKHDCERQCGSEAPV